MLQDATQGILAAIRAQAEQLEEEERPSVHVSSDELLPLFIASLIQV